MKRQYELLVVGVLGIGMTACGGAQPESSELSEKGVSEDDLAWPRCGTIAGISCGDGQYCDIGIGRCDVADAAGICRPKPRACITWIKQPVCGCDGQTYPSACQAAAAGVSIDHTGECAPPATQCRAAEARVCGDNQYCEMSDATCGPDTAGTCKSCVLTYASATVCGCDGRTYASDCAAAAAGVAVAYLRACN